MPPTLRCEDLVTYLSEYIDGNLDSELVDAAREHLATCQNCRVVLDSTQRTILLYREQAHQNVMTAARKDALFDKIAAAFEQSTKQDGDSM